MRHFILSAGAVAIVLGAIWLVSSNPRASEQLRAEDHAITMDIGAITRKAKNLPEPLVENFI